MERATSVNAEHKFNLKTRGEDGSLINVGRVLTNPSANFQPSYVVEGTELLIEANKEGKLILKQKDDKPDAKYMYAIVTGLFFNDKKKDGTPCTPYYRGKSREGDEFLLYPYEEKAQKKAAPVSKWGKSANKSAAG